MTDVSIQVFIPLNYLCFFLSNFRFTVVRQYESDVVLSTICRFKYVQSFEYAVIEKSSSHLHWQKVDVDKCRVWFDEEIIVRIEGLLQTNQKYFLRMLVEQEDENEPSFEIIHSNLQCKLFLMYLVLYDLLISICARIVTLSWIVFI